MSRAHRYQSQTLGLPLRGRSRIQGPLGRKGARQCDSRGRGEREEKRDVCECAVIGAAGTVTAGDTASRAAPDRGKTASEPACLSLSSSFLPVTTLRDVWRRRGSRPPPRGRPREPEDAGLEARNPGEEEGERRRRGWGNRCSGG